MNENDAHEVLAPGEEPARVGSAAGSAEPADGGLLGRIELIEAQPLDQRATHFEQLHDELLAELQRGDHGAP